MDLMQQKKRIYIMGSTGSIGRQALDVVREFPDRFEIVALAAGSNLDLLLEQAALFKPQYLAIGNQELYPALKKRIPGTKTAIYAGIDGMTAIATAPEVDLVLTAVVGAVGIQPTLAAILAGKEIALANKETLVAAGSIIIPAARESNVRIIPVDSEHSAIFQCLEGRRPDQTERLILTASGGPFRTWTPDRLENVTVRQALNHPNWSMGGKITIDSATMFNKGLEVIEAHWLFGVSFDRISVVIHPESVVHSMVELADGSILAQMGLCDMRLPIQLALTYPERLDYSFPKLTFSERMTLNFEPVNPELFPAVELAYAAGKNGGSLPAALNAANEEAVGAFLSNKINFTGIVRIVSAVMGYHQKEAFASVPGLDEIMAVDRWARLTARRLI
jgi:1-deoxy-D-xylulose-5-phosphate reductoisomerase